MSHISQMQKSKNCALSEYFGQQYCNYCILRNPRGGGGTGSICEDDSGGWVSWGGLRKLLTCQRKLALNHPCSEG